MSTQINDRFSFFVPAEIVKGKKKDGSEEMRIKGVCSSIAEDSDGQFLDPTGMDCAPLLKKGFFNWDHQSKKTSAAIVGQPDVAKVVNNGTELYVEGFLYPDSEEAKSVYNLAKVLEKNSPDRRLGFSIEGQVVEKDPLDERKIKKARITGIAITPCPKNPNTLLQLVKGECSEPLMKAEYDEEIDKAMEVNQDLTEHDVFPEKKVKSTTCPTCKTTLVEGKCPDCGYEVAKLVQKSEIYNLIAEHYTTDIEKAKQIYSLIENVNLKLFNMKQDNITMEAINKSFEFLNEATVLQKSEGGEGLTKGEGKENEEETEEKKMEKAKTMCKGYQEQGLSKGQMIDELCKSGFTTMQAAQACDSCIAEANDKKNGGDVTEVTQPLVKGEEVTAILGKIETLSLMKDETPDLIKSLTASMDGKFGALGKILKSTMEQNATLNTKLEELTKSNEDMLGRLEQVEAQPNAAKSTRRIQPAERFAKSENGTEGGAELGNLPAGSVVYELTKAEDRSALAGFMFEECSAARQGGKVNTMLEKAVGDLEICKSLPTAVLPWLKTKGIYVTKSE